MTQRKLKLKLSEEVTWYKFSASFYLLNINVVQVSALLHDTNIYLIQYPYLCNIFLKVSSVVNTYATSLFKGRSSFETMVDNFQSISHVHMSHKMATFTKSLDVFPLIAPIPSMMLSQSY